MPGRVRRRPGRAPRSAFPPTGRHRHDRDVGGPPGGLGEERSTSAASTRSVLVSTTTGVAPPSRPAPAHPGQPWRVEADVERLEHQDPVHVGRHRPGLRRGDLVMAHPRRAALEHGAAGRIASMRPARRRARTTSPTTTRHCRLVAARPVARRRAAPEVDAPCRCAPRAATVPAGKRPASWDPVGRPTCGDQSSSHPGGVAGSHPVASAQAPLARAGIRGTPLCSAPWPRRRRRAPVAVPRDRRHRHRDQLDPHGRRPHAGATTARGHHPAPDSAWLRSGEMKHLGPTPSTGPSPSSPAAVAGRQFWTRLTVFAVATSAVRKPANRASSSNGPDRRPGPTCR